VRYALLGDIHGNWEALEAVLAGIREDGADQYVCVGDVVGYNPDPVRCVDRVRDLQALVVQGNHDFFTVHPPGTMDMSEVASAALEWTCAHLHADHRQYLAELPRKRTFDDVTVVHNTLEQTRHWQYVLGVEEAGKSFVYQDSAVCFIGHTHVPVVFTKRKGLVTIARYETIDLDPESKYLFNVGSVGQPRDRDPRAAYVLYDSETRQVTLKRVAYEVGRTQEKIRKSGLPLWLALRLSFGV
jgi:diadenosine tetraphosphatase ApaH/serine/threonine PP2A family protein phosphatase